MIGPEPCHAAREWVVEDLGGGRWLSRSPALPLRQTPFGLVLGMAVGEDDPDSWAGRWVLLSGTTLELDACGLLGVFYRDGWISSSPELLRVKEPELALPEERLVYESGMDWFPPPRSGIEGISRLLPSQAIDIVSGQVRHRALLVEEGDASVVALAEMLVFSMEALRTPVDVSLTGGRDSRLVLAAALAAGLDVITTTTLWDGMPHADLVLPPRLAAIAGVPHYTARAGRVREDLLALFDNHCAHHSVERVRQGLASGHLPDFGRPVVSGLVFELGRFYYHDLPVDLNAGMNEKPAPEWAKWAREHPEPIDWRDRFYWEQRLAGWASSAAQAMDVAPFERFFPANSRRFVAGLLSFPEAQRCRGMPQQAVLERLSPELARVPINPERGNRVVRRVRREAHLIQRYGTQYLGRRANAIRSIR